MKIIKPRHCFFTSILVLINACSSSPEGSELTQIDELMIFIEKNYDEYKLLDSKFNPEVDSPYPDFTQYIQPGIDTGYPNLFSYDLNEDGYNEYIFRVFKTKAISSERYDSVFEARTILVFGGENGFIPTNKDFGYRGFVFNDKYKYEPSGSFGIVPAGTYKRGYPINDEITLSQPGLAGYTYYGVGVTEWINPDSSRSYTIYFD